MDLQKKNSANGKERLFNYRPLFFVAVYFCLGATLAYFVRVENASNCWAFVALFAPIFALPFVWKRFVGFSLAVVSLLIAFACGYNLFFGEVAAYENVKLYEGERIVVGAVTERVDRGGEIEVVLTDVSVDGNKINSRVVAYLSPSFSSVGLADTLMIRGKMEAMGNAVGRYGFLAEEIADRKEYVIDADGCAVIGESPSPFLRIRAKLQSVVKVCMEAEPASVTFALLTGDTSGMDKELLDNVRFSGIAHIFAVSGMHIGALYLFVSGLTKRTKLPEILKFLFVGGTLIFYGGVCGFSSSVLRAIVLCLTHDVCKALKITYDGLETLALAALIVLCLFPTLLFGVGFQLSFAACLGIALLNRPLLKLFLRGKEFLMERRRKDRDTVPVLRWRMDRLDEPKGVVERGVDGVLGFFAVSLSAQAGTFPVLVSAYGYASVAGVFLNCLFIPFVGAIFAILLCFSLASCVFPLSVGKVLLYPFSVVWSAALLVFEITDFSKYAVASEMGVQATVAYYMWLCLSSDKLNLRGRRVWYALSAFCIFTVCQILSSL